MSILVTLKFA